jgi:hypothetical protein
MRGWPVYREYSNEDNAKSHRQWSDDCPPDFWDVVDNHGDYAKDDKWLHEHTPAEIAYELHITVTDAQDMRWAAMTRLGVPIPMRRERIGRVEDMWGERDGTHYERYTWRNYRGA